MRESLVLFAVLALSAATLSLAIEPGVFTTDEASYLTTVRALRAGRLTVPGTEGLPPSRELLGFDPAPKHRAVAATPVAPTAPPLYALVALPFSLGGFPGLFFLQVLAFCAGGACVFVLARRLRPTGSSPWLALVLYGLGGYLLEYALGLWPHALSVALAAAALLAAAAEGLGWSANPSRPRMRPFSATRTEVFPSPARRSASPAAASMVRPSTSYCPVPRINTKLLSPPETNSPSIGKTSSAAGASLRIKTEWRCPS